MENKDIKNEVKPKTTQTDQVIPQVDPSQSISQIDEATQKKIDRLHKQSEDMTTKMKELEEEIQYLQQLGEKKSQLASIKANAMKLKEEIDGLKNNKGKKPVVEDEGSECDEKEEKEPMTVKGKKPAKNAEKEDALDNKNKKSKMLESGWQAYLAKNKDNKITDVEPDKFNILLG